MIQIKIDNQNLLAKENETVLQCAMRHDIYIPHLCFHPKTGINGNCRVCLVDIDNKLNPACSTLVESGMIVRTKSNIVRRTVTMILKLILESGHHNCLSCPANLHCALQDAVFYSGMDDYDIIDREMQPDTSSEFIVMDPDKCIGCGNCVAGCNNTVVNEVISFSGRGGDTQVTAQYNKKLGRSTCVQCGECSQLCPVGAIYDKNSERAFRDREIDITKTICTYCGVGCNIEIHTLKKTGKIIRIRGDEGSDVNNGMLCSKGRYGFRFVQSDRRLTTPLMKINGKHVPVDWDTAIETIASRFNGIIKNNGRNAIGGFSSAKCTNEDNYIFQKFFRVCLGNNNVDHCARLCHSSTVAGLAASLGSGAMTNNLQDIHKADVILVIGSDTTAAHPIIGNKIKQAVKFHKTKLIVIDPKKIELAKHASIYASQKPGSDTALINSIIHVILKKNLYDKNYICDRTDFETWELFKDEMIKDKHSPESVEAITGINAETLNSIGELFGAAKTAAVYFAMGITQHTSGYQNVLSIANLQLMCGNLGIDGGGVNPLRGQSNVQGACDVGCLPNTLPGYTKVNDSDSQVRFEEHWKTSLSNAPGLTITEMLDNAVSGDIKALYIMGENPVLSDPDQKHTIHALESLDFMVVQDIFMTETAKLADIVLPAVCFSEKTGHFTNTERRVQKLRKATQAPGLALDDWKIISDIAKAMGHNWDYKSSEEITDEINLTIPFYRGITPERTEVTGIQWPCPSVDHPGTSILHENSFPVGKAKFRIVDYVPPYEICSKEYPLILTTGRLAHQFHTGTMIRKSKEFDRLSPPTVKISQEDASQRDIVDGETVTVISARGEISIKAEVTDRIKKGVVFIPFHFHESPANLLTHKEIDPVAKIPEYKVTAVQVKKKQK